MLSPEVTPRLGRMLPSIAALCGCPTAECQQANPKREQGGQPSARLMGACHVILGYARGVARVLWLRAGVAIAGANAMTAATRMSLACFSSGSFAVRRDSTREGVTGHR